MNKHCSTGRLVEDPQIRTTQNDVSVCSFTLAVKRPNVKDTTDFLHYVAWNHSAEYICKYGKKGDIVEVTGVLTSRNYEDSNGNKRTAYEVRVDELRLISGGITASASQDTTQDTKTAIYPHTDSEDTFVELSSEEELPF